MIEFAEGRVVFLGYLIHKGSQMAGITLKMLAELRGMYRMVVTAIARKHETIIPRGEDQIQEGDILYFVCNKQDVPAINYLFGLQHKPTKTVFVLGGERVGEALVRRLASLKLTVKLIERDPQLCERLAEELDHVQVLNAEGTDVETLKCKSSIRPIARSGCSASNFCKSLSVRTVP